MSAREMRFEFPMPVNLANARMHWRVKQNAKEAFYAACDLKQAAGSFPAPPRVPFPKATATVTMHLGAPMDDDNAAARLKWIWDWLKTRGYLADDKRKALHQRTYPTQKIRRGAAYYVAVTITELAEVA
jgi:hypothetical protein